MRSNKHTGFSVVEALLIILILVALGLIGYFVYHTHKPANKTVGTAASPASYLIVNAWDIKLPVVTSGQYKLVIPSKVNGGVANPSSPVGMNNPSGNLQALELEASGLASSETKCSPDTTGYQSVGTVFRDTTLDTNKNVATLPLKKVGNYYYFLQLGFGDNCIAQPTAGQQAFLDAITKSFNQLQLSSPLSAANSQVGDFSFTYPTSWTVASNVRPDEALLIKSPGEQEDATGGPLKGAAVDVYSKVINSTWFGSSLSDYMKNYGSETPTSTTAAGYPALRIDSPSHDVVAVAFVKDNTVYGIEEYYAAGATNSYPTIVDDIAQSFKPAN